MAVPLRQSKRLLIAGLGLALTLVGAVIWPQLIPAGGSVATPAPSAPTVAATPAPLTETTIAGPAVSVPATSAAVATGTLPPTMQVAVTLPLARPIRYAALGASDTVGVGTTNAAQQNWTARIAAQLPPDTVYARFAKSGITLYESATTQVPQAIAFKPTLVSMWLVVNDVLRAVPLPVYRQELTATLNRLTRETDAQIVLLNVPDLAYLLPAEAKPQTRAQMSGVARVWNSALADTVRPYGNRVLIVDLYAPSTAAGQHLDWISGDGFHPSAAGYEQIANGVVAALKGARWLDGK
ncbi:MAG: GDSL-type esterase/lipase family protein [Chloroflexota bacterium]|nr:GDSL-type esterase/lipase family protein [Chloroflexota bacterium]